MSYREKFESFFGTVPASGKVKCHWHEDNDPSLVLNFEDGTFHCYGCGKTGHIDSLVGATKIIEEIQVLRYHRRLLDEPALVDWLTSARGKGLSMETIKAYRIGHDGARYTFPVYDAKGNCINIRRYSPTVRPKMLSYGEGYGTAAWFPWPPLSTDTTVYLMEGESDTLLARQMGLPAYTQTAGADSWTDAFTEALRGKKVCIIYDTDAPGRNGAGKVLNRIKYVVEEVRNIRLPTSVGSKDFSDWVLRDGATLQMLQELVQDTPPYALTAAAVGAVIDEPPIKLDLPHIGLAKYAFRQIETLATVAGKDRAPYLVPHKVVTDCPGGRPLCNGCPIGAGNRQFEIGWRDGKIIQFADVAEPVKLAILRDMLRVPSGCKACRINVASYQNIEKLAILSAASVMVPDEVRTVDNVLRRAYYIGAGIQANNQYIMRGMPVPDPRDQVSVLLVLEAEPLNDLEDEVDTRLCEIFREERHE